MKFYLIQRGKLNSGSKYFDTLTGRTGFTELDYMGSSEFEWGAIPKAYLRIMESLSDYDLMKMEMKTVDGLSLYLFSNTTKTAEIIDELKNFIKTPYHLKEYSALESHFNPDPSINPKWMRKNVNFWWDIENDWIAFIGTPNKAEAFKKVIEKDFNGWQTM